MTRLPFAAVAGLLLGVAGCGEGSASGFDTLEECATGVWVVAFDECQCLDDGPECQADDCIEFHALALLDGGMGSTLRVHASASLGTATSEVVCGRLRFSWEIDREELVRADRDGRWDSRHRVTCDLRDMVIFLDDATPPWEDHLERASPGLTETVETMLLGDTNCRSVSYNP
jgi:hypothetical protein